MGGDDLGGSDDELWNQPVVADINDSDDDSSEEEEEHADDYGAIIITPTNTAKQGSDDPNPKKRKNSSVDDDVTSSNNNTQKQKKKKKNLSKAQVLLQAGRDLERQDSTQQAAFLTTAIRHYALLQQRQQQKDEDTSLAEILPSYCVGNGSNNNSGSYSDRLVDRLRDCGISAKKLKQWKHVGSPCVLIVCISARRAVTVLKQVQSLKARCAKLFPKNASLEEHRQQLSETTTGLAVGTPHRLLQLATTSTSTSTSSNDETTSTSAKTKAGSAAVLSLEHTQLVVLDCHVSHKQYTVCTLPDTAPHCMALLQQAVLPQLQKNRCQVAFF